MDDLADDVAEEAVVSCEFHGGTISVFEDRVEIDRTKRSMFEDTTVPMAEIEDVSFSPGVMTGHIQLHRTGVEPASGGILSHPVDEYTLHFSRLDRDCAARARDAIIERAGVS